MNQIVKRKGQALAAVEEATATGLTFPTHAGPRFR